MVPRPANQAVILMYHRVADEVCDPWALCVQPERFDEQMATLRQLMEVVPLGALANDVANASVRRGSVAITFDDGYSDNIRSARPILERHGIPATFFVVSGYVGSRREFWWDELDRLLLTPGTLPPVIDLDICGARIQEDLTLTAVYTPEEAERYRRWRAWDSPPTARHQLYYALWRHLRPMPENERERAIDVLRTWADVSAAGRRHRLALTAADVSGLSHHSLIDVGCHTSRHPQLSSLPPPAQAEEIRDCQNYLEQALGRRVTAFSYPFGSSSDYTAETVAIVRELGFEYACSTAESTVSNETDLFQLPRLMVEDWDGHEFARRLAHWIGDV